MERSTGTSVLKWTIIVLNGLGLLISPLFLASMFLKGNIVPGYAAGVCFSIRIIFYLLNISLAAVTIVAACKEEPVLLKKIAWFYSGICIMGLLISTFEYIGITRDFIKEECLKKEPVELCKSLISNLDDALPIGLLMSLFISILYFLLIWRLANNLLAEKPATSQSA